MVKYINEKITKLNSEKESIEANFSISKKKPFKKLFISDKNYIFSWKKMSVEDKIVVVDAFIKTIRVFENEIEIIWKI